MKRRIPKEDIEKLRRALRCNVIGKRQPNDARTGRLLDRKDLAASLGKPWIAVDDIPRRFESLFEEDGFGERGHIVDARTQSISGFKEIWHAQQVIFFVSERYDV